MVAEDELLFFESHQSYVSEPVWKTIIRQEAVIRVTGTCSIKDDFVVFPFT